MSQVHVTSREGILAATEIGRQLRLRAHEGVFMTIEEMGEIIDGVYRSQEGERKLPKLEMVKLQQRMRNREDFRLGATEGV